MPVEEPSEVCAFDWRFDVKFAPAGCRDSNATSRCIADRDALRSCPVVLGRALSKDAPSVYVHRRSMLSAVANRSIAIVGDSMARQAYAVLIARLRGLDVVLDFNVHTNVHYLLLRSVAQIADALDLPHLPLSLLSDYGGALCRDSTRPERKSRRRAFGCPRTSASHTRRSH